MPLHDWNWSWTPAFIGRRIGLSAADRERGNHVEAERRRVVVVDQENDIGRVLRQPGLRRLIAREDRLPIRFSALAEIEGRADGGYVRGVNACCDRGHAIS